LAIRGHDDDGRHCLGLDGQRECGPWHWGSRVPSQGRALYLHERVWQVLPRGALRRAWFGAASARAVTMRTEEYRESHLRSVLKGVSWRVFATTTTVSIAWLWLESASLALSIGAMEFTAKVFLFYAHERIWQVLPRGELRRLLGRKAAPKTP